MGRPVAKDPVAHILVLSSSGCTLMYVGFRHVLLKKSSFKNILLD